MNPDHCKDVSLRHVDFSLTVDNIARNIAGKKAYTCTGYMILRHGEEIAVIKAMKQGGRISSARYPVTRSFPYQRTLFSSGTKQSTF